MDDGRWVKQVYEEGRARLERRANASMWCNLTRKWLLELGLREEWEAQATGPEWQEALRARMDSDNPSTRCMQGEGQSLWRRRGVWSWQFGVAMVPM